MNRRSHIIGGYVFGALLISSIASAALTITHATISRGTISRGAGGSDPSQPTLPQSTVDTTMPSCTTSTNVNSGGDLQAAINSASLGDCLVLQAGATFTGNYILPNTTTGSGWITIKSSALSSLPAGTRVGNSGTNMAKISAPDQNAGALNFRPSANHYRFAGIEITGVYASTTSTLYNLIDMGNDTSGFQVTTLAQLPTFVIFDRCYIHGTATGNFRRGVMMNSRNTAVIDSYLSNFHEVGQDSQAIASWNGDGPFLIRNNYLEGAGENVLFGGSSVDITNLIPSDITVQDNLISKPLTWKISDPSYAGVHWAVKNLFELKNAQRVLVDHNILQYDWVDGQTGNAVLFTTRTQSCAYLWNRVQDVTFRNNKILHAREAIQIVGNDSDCPSDGILVHRIAVKNNLFNDISSAWNDNGSTGQGYIFQTTSGADYITIQHNTLVNSNSGYYLTSDIINATNTKFVDNLLPNLSYGVTCSSGVGQAALDNCFTSPIFSYNAIYGPYPSDQGMVVSQYGTYQASNFFPADVNAVGFTNFAGGNYSLSTGSAYHNAASDGTDVGANIPLLP